MIVVGGAWLVVLGDLELKEVDIERGEVGPW